MLGGLGRPLRAWLLASLLLARCLAVRYTMPRHPDNGGYYVWTKAASVFLIPLPLDCRSTGASNRQRTATRTTLRGAFIHCTVVPHARGSMRGYPGTTARAAATQRASQ